MLLETPSYAERQGVIKGTVTRTVDFSITEENGVILLRPTLKVLSMSSATRILNVIVAGSVLGVAQWVS